MRFFLGWVIFPLGGIHATLGKSFLRDSVLFSGEEEASFKERTACLWFMGQMEGKKKGDVSVTAEEREREGLARPLARRGTK